MCKRLVQGTIDFTGTGTFAKKLISKVFTCANAALRLITIKTLLAFIGCVKTSTCCDLSVLLRDELLMNAFR